MMFLKESGTRDLTALKLDRKLKTKIWPIKNFKPNQDLHLGAGKAHECITLVMSNRRDRGRLKTKDSPESLKSPRTSNASAVGFPITFYHSLEVNTTDLTG